MGDLDGQGWHALVYGAYEGFVAVLDPRSGAERRRAALGGFPFAVARADLDGDGRDEVLASAADGPLYNVAGGRLVAGGPPLVVCGGIDRHVYVLSPDGAWVATYTAERLPVEAGSVRLTVPAGAFRLLEATHTA